MGVLVDIVPNHMGVASPEQNRWWWDLLRLGRSSAYADAFDVDWEAFGDRVMVPVLGDGGETPDTASPASPADQHYELVSWRRGDAELNYRRFFTITTLAGVRVEEPWVFAESHREIGRWFAEGLVDGLRVDHPDGLLDPGAYLEDLARLTGGAYVLVEKILEPGEGLPTSWATAGTTGYDALGLIDRVLVDPGGQAPLDALEARLRGVPVDWASLTHDTKRAVADGALLAEVRRIARSLVEEGALAPVRTRRGRRRRGARLLPRLPLVPPAGPRAPRPGAGRRARASPRPRHRLRRARTGAVRPEPPGGAAVPADERDGDGQGRRGLRVLPLLPAHVPQRGRRRPGGLLRRAVGLPRGDGRAAARLARGDDRDDDPRHQAQRGHPGADRRAGRAPRRLAGRARPAARAGAAARPRLRVAAVAGGRRRVAGEPRTPAPVRREGHARGRRAHHLDRPRRVVRGRDARRRRRGVRLRRGTCGRRRPRRRARRARPQQRPRHQAARADDPRRAGRLPGHRAVGPQPGRPRQPPARRLRRPGRAARRRRPPQAPRHHDRPAAAARPARAVHVVRRRAGLRPGRRPRAGLRPRRRGHGRDPAAGRPRRARRLGRHRARARGDLARRADRPGRDRSPRRRAPRPARGAAGEGRLHDASSPQISVRRVGAACATGPAVGGRCHRRDDARGRRLVGPRRPCSRHWSRRSTTAT